jgi:MFS family permease
MSKIEPDMQPRAHREISNFRVIMITAFVAFGGFLFGYDCVIGGGLPEVKQFALDFGTPQPPDGKYGFPAALKGGFVSILSVGTFMGALSASQFADRFGRRLGLMITCVIFGVGIAVQTWASTITVLMVGRWIAGFGVGLVSVMIPLYQAECVPARQRGAVVSCYQLAITIGLLVGQIVAFTTKDKEDVNAYRILIGLQFVWSGILGLAMFFFPETPRYLIRVGKWDAAVASKVRLTGLRPDSPLIQEELEEIKANYEWEKTQGSATYADCWRGLNRKRTLLGIFMQAWQQRNYPLPLQIHLPKCSWLTKSHRGKLHLLLWSLLLQGRRARRLLQSLHDYGHSELSLHFPWPLPHGPCRSSQTPPLGCSGPTRFPFPGRNYPCRKRGEGTDLDSRVFGHLYCCLCCYLGTLCLGYYE